MRIEGTIVIGPYASGTKSARQHQAFLLTSDGERLLLRRYDGPSLRDEVLEAMAGQHVVAEGIRRDHLFIAKALHQPGSDIKGPSSGKAPSA